MRLHFNINKVLDMFTSGDIILNIRRGVKKIYVKVLCYKGGRHRQ